MKLVRPIVLCLLLAGTAGCDDAPTGNAAPPPPPSVTVASVGYADVATEYSFIGRVQAIEEIELQARVEGFVLERPFDDGQDVSEGQLLFRIEPEVYEAAVALAQATVARAQATSDETEKALDRQAKLLERGNTSQAAYDEAFAAHAGAAADLAARQAELRQAEIQLGYTAIVSPLDGRIGASQVSRGELIGPQTGGLVTVTRLDSVHVVFQLSERDYVALQRQRLDGGTGGDGSQVDAYVRLPDGELHPEIGIIDFVGNAIDPTSGTVPVRLIVANPGRLLLPGQFVTVELRGKEVAQQLVVPQVAVQEDQTGTFVLVVDADQRATPRPVTLGAQYETFWVVTEGLQPGDLVIVEGAQKVRPGVTVAPVMQATSG